MDPFTHTLFGAALGKSPLGRRTTYATATLVVGANLPDVDAVLYLVGSDPALEHRRGWTHGALAMVVLPLLLALVMLALDALARRRARRPPADVRWLLLLSYVAVLSHPLLDLLNTYGVRLLMPFDGRWFYGDTLFIVDPWVWLLLGGLLFVVSPGRRWLSAGLVLLALLASLVLFASPDLSMISRLTWVGGLVALVVVRRTQSGRRGRHRLLVGLLLGLFSLYVVGMLALAGLSRWMVKRELAERGDEARSLMVGPIPVTPLVRQVVVADGEGYRTGTFAFLREPRLVLADRRLRSSPQTAVVEAAWSAACVEGFAGWARFPFARTEEVEGRRGEGGWVVHLLDARYAQRPTSGFGGVAVRVDERLQPSCER